MRRKRAIPPLNAQETVQQVKVIVLVTEKVGRPSAGNSLN
jgi:hypothetical protein